MKTSDAANGKWRGILLEFGIPDHYLNGKHSPCPLCEGKDRFRFTNFNQNGDYFCSGCGPGDGFSLLTGYLQTDFKTIAKRIDKMVNNISSDPEKPKHDPLPLLRYVQKNAAYGSKTVEYLRRRGLNPLNCLRQVALKYYEDGKPIGEYACMTGLIVDVDNQPVSYHITYLQDGKKAPVEHQKKILPGKKSINGCAIRLVPNGLSNEDETIAVTEGIETGLAVGEMINETVYAALNTNGMEKLEIPAFVKRVLIYGDNDKNFAGQKASYTLANRLKIHKYTKHLEVEVHIPPKPGTDWLNYYIENFN